MIKKVGLLFPGQGSQYPGMREELCKNFIEAKRTFEEASDALKLNLHKLCFYGSEEELLKTENTQPVIVTASMAFYRIFKKEFDIKPNYGAGHSIGEISALACAQVLTLHDAVLIAKARGQLMQRACLEVNNKDGSSTLGTMYAIIGASKEDVENRCQDISKNGKIACISNYNSHEQYIISGHTDALIKVCQELEKCGARSIALKVSGPFHSSLMKQASEEMALVLKEYDFKEPQWPIVSNVNALPYFSKNYIPQMLVRQIVAPVRWVDSIEYLNDKGMKIAIELGPGTVLKNLLTRSFPDIKVFSYDREKDVESLFKYFSEKENEAAMKKQYNHTVITRCIVTAVCVKNRNWDNEEYKKGVIEPYRKIVQLQKNIEKESREPTPEEMEKALHMLDSVFKTKQVPEKEQQELFVSILKQTRTEELFPNFYKQKAVIM